MVDGVEGEGGQDDVTGCIVANLCVPCSAGLNYSNVNEKETARDVAVDHPEVPGIGSLEIGGTVVLPRTREPKDNQPC